MTHSLEVDDQHHVVELRKAGHKLDVYLGFLASLQAPAVIANVELGLEASPVSGHAHHVVDVNLGGICQVYGLLDWELIRNTAEVDDLFRELECGSYYMALESKSQHLRAAFEREPEGLRELAEDITFEGHLDEVADILVHSKDAFSLAELELGAKWRLVGNELPMAIYLSCVLNAYCKFPAEVDEDVSDVLLRQRQLRLRSLALASHVQCQALF